MGANGSESAGQKACRWWVSVIGDFMHMHVLGEKIKTEKQENEWVFPKVVYKHTMRAQGRREKVILGSVSAEEEVCSNKSGLTDSDGVIARSPWKQLQHQDQHNFAFYGSFSWYELFYGQFWIMSSFHHGQYARLRFTLFTLIWLAISQWNHSWKSSTSKNPPFKMAALFVFVSVVVWSVTQFM